MRDEDGGLSDDSSISSAGGHGPYGKRHIALESVFGGGHNSHETVASLTDTHDYAQLSRGLQKRADQLHMQGQRAKRESEASFHDSHSSAGVQSLEIGELLHHHHDDAFSVGSRDSHGSSRSRRRSSRDRFANKVLGRLYSRRAFTAGLVFSRGHFLGDVSKMVAGLLSTEYVRDEDDGSAICGFGEKTEGKRDDPTDAPIDELVIHEQERDQLVAHSSTLAAGKDGCVVLVFPKSSLTPFLDEYPGLLLSLLGTQVVV